MNQYEKQTLKGDESASEYYLMVPSFSSFCAFDASTVLLCRPLDRACSCSLELVALARCKGAKGSKPTRIFIILCEASLRFQNVTRYNSTELQSQNVSGARAMRRDPIPATCNWHRRWKRHRCTSMFQRSRLTRFEKICFVDVQGFQSAKPDSLSCVILAKSS